MCVPDITNGRSVADGNLKRIFFNEVFRFHSDFTELFPGGLIDNRAALAQVMAERRSSNKPLS